MSRAEFIYEVCRLEAIASKRPIVPEFWQVRGEAFREQFTATTNRLCADGFNSTTPKKEHESWMRAYQKMGWKYGPVRDVAAKTHPDLVPFDELPILEREKDEVFLAVCALAKKYIKEEKE